jgi:hypothetical protein
MLAAWRGCRAPAGAKPEADDGSATHRARALETLTAMRGAEFLDGVAGGLRRSLPPQLAGFEARRQAHLLKLWYREPRLHYEVWPVAGRDLIEVGLHFEAEAEVNLRLLRWFDPHLPWLAATLDGAVELEQWTATWGHIFHVFHASTLDAALQAEVVGWLGRLIPVAEPILQAALDEMGPIAASPRRQRDWAAWRERRARRARQTAM